VRKGYGKECDVWSAGNILYILLCLRFDNSTLDPLIMIYLLIPFRSVSGATHPTGSGALVKYCTAKATTAPAMGSAKKIHSGSAFGSLAFSTDVFGVALGVSVAARRRRAASLASLFELADAFSSGPAHMDTAAARDLEIHQNESLGEYFTCLD